MMDFILTSILAFGTGVIVGRLFYKLNPFFMLFGLVLGGAMLVMSLQMNGFYSIAMIFGVVYGLMLMKQRNISVADAMHGDGSLLGKVTDFLYMKFMLKDAEKFRQQQAEEDSAYDQYKQYEKQAYEDAQQQSEEKNRHADEQAQKARNQQEDIHKQWQQFEEAKRQQEQQSKQQAEQEPIDTRSNYEILGVSESATLAEIKKAYKKLSMKLHADRNQNRSPAFIKEAEKELVKVNLAYEALTGKKK